MYKVALRATLRGCVAVDDDKGVYVDFMASVATKLFASIDMDPAAELSRKREWHSCSHAIRLP